MITTFFLGAHHPNWLWDPRFTGVPLFVSHMRLRDRVSRFPRALTSWALDSGGFSVIKKHGQWTFTAAEYVACVRRYADELGMPIFAAPMDWMCEPWVIQGKNKHLSPSDPKYFHGTRAARGIGEHGPDEPFADAVRKHQRWTVDSYLELRALAPDIPWMPVLQGWTLADYIACAEMYAQAGVDLAACPVVGLGSVCRRQATGEIAEIVAYFADRGIALHGFGVKTEGLDNYGPDLISADSMAWSFAARRLREPAPGCRHRAKNCANCPDFALAWRRRVLETLPAPGTTVRQRPLLVGGELDMTLALAG